MKQENGDYLSRRREWHMISLISYDEFGPGMGFKSMKEYFEAAPYENQEKIVFYLDNGIQTYVRASKGRDFYTGELIPGSCTGMTDGEYSWNSALSYYVKKYNLRLPAAFEKKVLEKMAE